MISLDISDNYMGVLLPKSSPQIERKFVQTYVENALNGNFSSAIMCRGLDRQAGAKYGTLEHKTEGVRLDVHQWNTSHWDITQVYNVKRYGTGYFNNDELITSNNNVWDIAGLTTNFLYEHKRRFVEYIRDNKKWLRYTSLIERLFRVTIDVTVRKIGGGVGEFHLSIVKRDGITGNLIYYYNNDKQAITRFGSGEGILNLTFKTPVLLNRNDEIAIICMKTNGQFNIETGSTIDFIEY